MKSGYDVTARKRPVNLSLNEDLLSHARELTTNLSGVVETLLADYVRQEQSRRERKAKALRDAVANWNAFNERHGSYADEHSTL